MMSRSRFQGTEVTIVTGAFFTGFVFDYTAVPLFFLCKHGRV